MCAASKCPPTSSSSSGDWFTSPKHAISPGRHTTFLTRVKVITEQIVLVRRDEVRQTFIETTEHLKHIGQDSGLDCVGPVPL